MSFDSIHDSFSHRENSTGTTSMPARNLVSFFFDEKNLLANMSDLLANKSDLLD
jgi:hypothetical protein